MSLCFLIPVKLDTPSQETYLHRCLTSIRALYPTTPVYVVRAVGTHLQLRPDPQTHIVTNPSFSTFGAMRLFEEHRYADTACILHDSMVLLKPLPDPLPDLQFLYHFDSHGFEHPANLRGYNRIVPHEAHMIVTTLQVGCFGNALIIRHDRLRQLNLMPLYGTLTTKYDFECMERILAYRVQAAGLLRSSLCGAIYDPIANPWAHPEYATMTLEEIRRSGFPYPILKSCIARR